MGVQIAAMLERADAPFVVIERDHTLVANIRQRGGFAVLGDAASDVVLEAAGTRHARVIVIPVPDGSQSFRVLAIARALNPTIKAAVGADSETELAYLESMGANIATTGERELALALGGFAVACFARG
jgi:K+:H+ antiporter